MGVEDVFPIILLSYLYERNDYSRFVLFFLTEYMPSVKVELIKAYKANWLWQGHGREDDSWSPGVLFQKL